MISSILIKTKRKEGFTLIELLVVIAIIGTLSTIGFLALSGASDGADDAKRLAELNNIRTAATTELSRNRAYPIVNSGVAVLASGSKTTSYACTRLDVPNTALTDLKSHLQGIDGDKYWYCSDKTGTEFAVATALNKLPTFTQGVTGTLGTTTNPDPATYVAAQVIQLTCGASGADNATYCVGNISL